MLNLVALVQNTAIVAIAAVVVALLADVVKRPKFAAQALSGGIFGAAGMLSMAHPAIVTEGLFFDGRIPVVVLSGAMGGPLAGGVAAGMVGAMRFMQGGVGAVAGIAGIAVASLGGVLLHLYFHRRGGPIRFGDLLLAGALAAAIPLASLPLLGDAELALRMLSGPSSRTAVSNFIGVSGVWSTPSLQMARG